MNYFCAIKILNKSSPKEVVKNHRKSHHQQNNNLSVGVEDGGKDEKKLFYCFSKV